ncbi:MAG TPA: AgmX/PglI C-terminal domain-containing protein [Gammaproteobacteria bacterium]|nr:AgmX/PglI C-terminal domain-containing protein [Gammaproteobacteria bacterium]
MSSIYRQFVLPWTRVAEEDRRLKVFIVTVLSLALLLSVVIPLIPVPEEDRNKAKELPPRLAQLVMEKQKPKPKPKPEPKKVEKKEEKKEEKEEKKKPEKKKEEPKPKKKVEPPKPKPKVDRVAEARKKAASAGLLAFSDDLADLRDAPVAPRLNKGKSLSKGGQAAKKRERRILTSGATSSGGINTANLSSGVGNTNLAGRQSTQVESPVDMVAAAGPATPTAKDSKKPSRTYEEVSLVFDRNKGAIYSLYSRALRKDPTLQGKVVLEITIAPSGEVTACKVISSELNDARLERRLVARVKMLNFGARDVETLIVTYPIDFLPS